MLCCPEKLKTALQIVPPTTQKLLRGFLGAVGWFRLWIADFAKIQAPLNELLKGTSGENRKFAPGEWKDYHQKAFLTLKKALVSFPILSVFDPARQTAESFDCNFIDARDG